MTNEQLVARIQGGGNIAENMLSLWEQNKGFISVMARKYEGYAELEDLEQSGYIGLNDAAQHYDPDKEMSFIGYAAFWIKRRMRECVSESRSVHLPFGLFDKVVEYKRFVREYSQNYGCNPSEREIQAAICVGREKLQRIQEAARMTQMQSLSKPVQAGEEECILEDLIAADGCPEENVIEAVDREEFKKIIWDSVDGLPDIQPVVIRQVYQEGKTRDSAGSVIGKTGNTIRAAESKGLRALRRKFYGNTYRKYFEEYIQAASFRHVGIKEFNHSWTSTTEAEVLRCIRE